MSMRATTAHPLDDRDRWAISVPEAGRRLDISRAHAYRLVASGELPSVATRAPHGGPAASARGVALGQPAAGRFSGGLGDEQVERTTGASASGGLPGFAVEEVVDGEAAAC